MDERNQLSVRGTPRGATYEGDRGGGKAGEREERLELHRGRERFTEEIEREELGGRETREVESRVE